MLGMPERTAYDVHFRLLGIPVRIHPLFWIVTAILGSQNEGRLSVLIWIACVFVSILVHEYGHGLMSRAFRCSPSIVLYSMGGLCFSEADRQTPWQRLAVLFAGPGAGLLLYACVEGIYFALPGLDHGAVGWEIHEYMVFINFWWSLVNLLPIWPLDGGQITGIVLTMLDRRKGMNWTHAISLVTAGILSVWEFQKVPPDMYLGLFFALFGVMNFQILQAHHQTAKYGPLEDDADWWKR
jgi:stage IV sporulation protein FB